MRRNRGSFLFFAAAVMALGTGCSRNVLNYQVAECIGTLGKYENNAPVETPKMKAERERQESEDAYEAQKQAALDAAAQLALEYRYTEAIECLAAEEALADDARAKEAQEEYQKQLDRMYTYEGAVPHFSFTNLVVDTERAFDGDEYEKVYRENMITLTEFQNILQTMYENGYVLVDFHNLAEETADGSGGVRLTQKSLQLPEGKKPMILSLDNLSYSSVRNGDGVATRLTVDDEGKVAAVYTDGEGHELIGAYDVIPVLEAFIEEHPDFSYQGARGIASVSGKNGVFGYPVEAGEGVDNSENEEMIRKIAEALRTSGWTIGCSGYGYEYMGTMSYEALAEDMTTWLEKVGSLVGDCDTLLFPYGSEVDYSTEKGAFLINRGFRYLIGMWAEGDHLEVNETYLRQTRRMVTGYVFVNLPGAYSSYFSTSAVLDADR